MTRYLLDTDTLIDFAKGREPTRSRMLQLIEAGDTLAVCAITVAEFHAGLAPEQRPAWDELLNALPYWPITRESAAMAGHDRWRAAREGRALTTTDALIAATGRAYDATILTNNFRDFQLTGLPLRSLRNEQH